MTTETHQTFCLVISRASRARVRLILEARIAGCTLLRSGLGEVVTIVDSSPESAARIRVVFDKGKVSSVDPDSTIFFLGGG